MPETPAKPLLDGRFLAKLEQLELVSRKIFLGLMKGERRSKRKGQSVEFADYRNYVKGDDLRFLDWNLYARLDRLFIRLFMEEEDLHFYVVIDNSLSMDFGKPTKLHFAKQVAAALAFIGLFNMDRAVIEADNEDQITGSSPLLKKYNHSMAAFPAALNEFCVRRGIPYLFTSNQVPFDSLVLTYRRQRGLVKYASPSASCWQRAARRCQ